MWLLLVVSSLVWGLSAGENMDTTTWLEDYCDEGDVVCYPLEADSFEQFAVELQTPPVVKGYRDDFNFQLYYHQTVKCKATPKLTPGDAWNSHYHGRVIARHPIYMSENKYFVQLYLDRVEVIKIHEEGEEIVTDRKGRKVFRIMSDFLEGQHINEDDLKHSFVFDNFLFISSTKAIDLNKYIHFDEADKLISSEKLLGIVGRIDRPYWSYGMIAISSIGYGHVSQELGRISSECFGNADVFCSFDQLSNELVISSYPVALRLGKFVMEQRWTEVVNDQVPYYRFRHMDMDEDEVFYFPNAKIMYYWLIKNGGPDKGNLFLIPRGVMPQPKLTDKIFDLMMDKTTPAPEDEGPFTPRIPEPIEWPEESTTPPPIRTAEPPRPAATYDPVIEEEYVVEEPQAESLSWTHIPQMVVIVGMMYIMVVV